LEKDLIRHRLTAEIKKLERELAILDNDKYRTIMEWETYDSICDWLSCRNCILRDSNGCCLPEIHFLFRKVKDKIVSNGRKMTKSVIITGILCSPLIWMPLSFIQTRITTAPTAAGTSQGFGMTIPQILITTPFEFFSTAFPYFGILSLIGMNDLWDNKEEIGTKLILIAFSTMIIGIICSLFTPFFPRYFLTVSFIFILISAVACANFTELIESDKNKILVFFIILGFLLAFQNGDYIAHYFTQRYVC